MFLGLLDAMSCPWFLFRGWCWVILVGSFSGTSAAMSSAPMSSSALSRREDEGLFHFHAIVIQVLCGGSEVGSLIRWRYSGVGRHREKGEERLASRRLGTKKGLKNSVNYVRAYV